MFQKLPARRHWFHGDAILALFSSLFFAVVSVLGAASRFPSVVTAVLTTGAVLSLWTWLSQARKNESSEQTAQSMARLEERAEKSEKKLEFLENVVGSGALTDAENHRDLVGRLTSLTSMWKEERAALAAAPSIAASLGTAIAAPSRAHGNAHLRVDEPPPKKPLEQRIDDEEAFILQHYVMPAQAGSYKLTGHPANLIHLGIGLPDELPTPATPPVLQAVSSSDGKPLPVAPTIESTGPSVPKVPSATAHSTS